MHCICKFPLTVVGVSIALAVVVQCSRDDISAIPQAIKKPTRGNSAFAERIAVGQGPDAKPSTDSNINVLSPEELEERANFLTTLQIDSGDEQMRIALKTADRMSEYVEKRKVRLPSFYFDAVIKRRQFTENDHLARRILQSTGAAADMATVPAVKYQRDNQQQAIADFVGKFKSDNEAREVKDVEDIEEHANQVTPCGIFIDLEHGFLSATPDGLFGTKSIVFVHCPYSSNGWKSLEESCTDNSPYTLENGRIKLKHGHNFYTRVQGQLHITGRQRCYFIVWLGSGMVYYEVIQKDEALFNEIFPKLERFYKDIMLPLIINEKKE